MRGRKKGAPSGAGTELPLGKGWVGCESPDKNAKTPAPCWARPGRPIPLGAKAKWAGRPADILRNAGLPLIVHVGTAAAGVVAIGEGGPRQPAGQGGVGPGAMGVFPPREVLELRSLSKILLSPS